MSDVGCSVEVGSNEFQGRNSQIIDTTLNYLYPSESVFIRELICNAFDALEKIRYLSRTDPTLIADGDEKLGVKMITNFPEKTLTIIDNGIGMTKKHVVEYIGVVARSGTKEFKEQLPLDSDISLFGESGTGFYTAFKAADKIQIITKHKDDLAYVFECTDLNLYTIHPYNGEEEISRGTRVILHLNAGNRNLLAPFMLAELIDSHFFHADYPIIIETKWNEEDDNMIQPLKHMTNHVWSNDFDVLTEGEINKLYEEISFNKNSHIFVKHIKYHEASISFEALIYVPKKDPHFCTWNTGEYNVHFIWKGLKLPKRKECLLPTYMDFVSVIVNVDTKLLNANRTDLQGHLRQEIGQVLVENVLNAFSEIAEDPEMFDLFHNQYYKNIEYGVLSDSDNCQKLLALMGFYTLKNKEKAIRMCDYVEKMKPDQKEIYYLIEGDEKPTSNSPFLEHLRKRDYDAILIQGETRQRIIGMVISYEDMELVDVSKMTREPENNLNEDYSKILDEYRFMLEKIKELLGDKIVDLKISQVPLDVPCCISTVEEVEVNKILIINHKDPIINYLKESIRKMENSDILWKNIATLLYSTAVIRSGNILENCRDLPKLMFRFVNKYLEDVKLTSVSDAESKDELNYEIDSSPMNRLA
nr:heat shock protein [Hymenolepis microstoma]